MLQHPNRYASSSFCGVRIESRTKQQTPSNLPLPSSGRVVLWTCCPPLFHCLQVGNVPSVKSFLQVWISALTRYKENNSDRHLRPRFSLILGPFSRCFASSQESAHLNRNAANPFYLFEILPGSVGKDGVLRGGDQSQRSQLHPGSERSCGGESDVTPVYYTSRGCCFSRQVKI